MNDLINLGIENKKGVPVVGSRKIAEVFGKQHFHILRDIQNLDCSTEFRESNFGVSSYRDEQNKKQPEILLTRDGFTFLAMGFTGKKAAAFKEAYIKQFNEMEDELKTRKALGEVRRDLLDVIRDTGLDASMHGWAYSTITDFVYKMTIGAKARDYRVAHGLPKDANVRDHLTPEQRIFVAKVEAAAGTLIGLGYGYGEMKAIIGEKLSQQKRLEAK
jgi:Rha family phage regulatory protein